MGRSGSSTLNNRVKRHVSLSSTKKIHWHIDYLLENENSLITRVFLIPSNQKLECKISQELFNLSNSNIKSFGSSDCNCKSHLLYFRDFMPL
jgi:Uri superfamily endonuclease